MLRLLAPAKLNLFLRVIGQRPDGYHEIETLFERIDLIDELACEPAPSGVHLTCNNPALDCGPSNLVSRAATLLQQAAGTSRGATLHLTKRIPIASGLGGGSSDAATALLGLNRLWKLGLPNERLRELGAQLGSDVPFFLEEAPMAVGRGRGERCEPLAGPLPSLWHVLVVPPVALSTQDVYGGFARSPLTAPRPSINIALHALRNGSLCELAAGLVNDLQPEAIRRCPVIEAIRQQLSAHECVGTMVSGSGPSIFGLCEDRAHAQLVSERLRKEGDPSWRIAVVKTHDTL